MAFDQSTIISGPIFSRRGGDTRVSWTSSAAPGVTYQIYRNGNLTWHGAATACVLPGLAAGDLVQVGTVGPGEAQTDFSASLPTPPGGGSRATFGWYGGRYLSEALVGFNVYRGATPGGAVSYAARVGFVPANSAGKWLDGFGRGGFGRGGFGRAANSYGYTSGPLSNGTWHFGVKPVDAAGNLGAASEWAIAVAAPPAPPARLPAGRPAISYDPATGIATLSWGASPG